MLQAALLGTAGRRMLGKQARPSLRDAVEEPWARQAGPKSLHARLLGATLTEWAQEAGQGSATIAGEQPEAWKYSDQQWPEATLNLLPIGGESLESVPRKPDAQRGAPNHWDVFSSNLLGAPLMSAFLSSVYRAVRGDPSFPH